MNRRLSCLSLLGREVLILARKLGRSLGTAQIAVPYPKIRGHAHRHPSRSRQNQLFFVQPSGKSPARGVELFARSGV